MQTQLGLLTIIALPAAAGIFAKAPFIVPVVLGANWLAAVPLIQILGIFGAIALFHSSMHTFLFASGHPAAAARAQAVFVLVLAMLLAALVGQYAVTGAALAVVGASFIATFAYLFAVYRHSGIGPVECSSALYRGHFWLRWLWLERYVSHYLRISRKCQQAWRYGYWQWVLFPAQSSMDLHLRRYGL